jgi:hypothetical protein
MHRSKLLPVVAIALGSCGARAADLLGLYVGAAAGPADTASYTASGWRQGHDTGWKVEAGVRPLPFLGAQIEYIDFGHAASSWYTETAQWTGKGGATAEGLFAVGYLPVVPRLAVFAKVGFVHVHTAADATGLYGGAGVLCQINPPPQHLHASQSEPEVGYGGGVQLLRSLALRAEYERASTAFGHAGLLSFGTSWTF